MLGINAPDVVEDWAYNDLQNSGKTWKLGAYHFPIYPVMPEGQNNDGYPWLRKPIEEGRLDILFEGHEHSFARTYPTKGDELFDKPSEGTVHYIVGNGGGNIYRSNAQKIWHSCFYPQEIRVGAYTLVEIDGNKLTATDLCTQTKMLKSQMNRTLTLLEGKGIVERVRSQQARSLWVLCDSRHCMCVQAR